MITTTLLKRDGDRGKIYKYKISCFVATVSSAFMPWEKVEIIYSCPYTCIYEVMLTSDFIYHEVGEENRSMNMSFLY